MASMKDVISEGLLVLDVAYNKMQKAKDEQFGYSEAISYYQGCLDMFKYLTAGFEIEINNGMHQLK